MKRAYTKTSHWLAEEPYIPKQPTNWLQVIATAISTSVTVAAVVIIISKLSEVI